MLRNLGFSSADIGISSKTLNPIEMFYVYITCIILDFQFSDQEKKCKPSWTLNKKSISLLIDL